ncbi:hypothetical protein GTY23_23120 [Streptomyces sp. SID5998]|nr:hypothetical protein [Streptomyces sp. SID5998]
MTLIEETYFGWDPLTHTVDCPTPVWNAVEIRRTTGARPATGDTTAHACTNELCGHANEFTRVQLRLLCRDCDTVYLISGEGLTEACTHTSLTGWGQAPTRVGEVWLWPGRPVIPGGQPHEYLVTRQAAALTRTTVYGIITGYHDDHGRPRWIAAAVPDPDGAFEIATFRWRHRRNAFEDLAVAADWIATTDTRAQHPVVVTD